MDREPVKSSNVKSLGWHDNVLEVEFANGGRYRYHGCPEFTYRQAQNCESPGKYLREHVIGKLKHRRVA